MKLNKDIIGYCGSVQPVLQQPPCCMPLRVLNLYCGIGGNRKLWENVQVTAVEYNEDIAGVYKENYQDDTVVVGDAHEYLMKHYNDFDFIWASPPCPTHSRAGFWGGSRGVNRFPKFPDMKLWQEIIFLRYYAKSKWVIENVIPYYDEEMKVFLPPTVELQRHWFWSNFPIRHYHFEEKKFDLLNVKGKDSVYGFSLTGKKMSSRKDTILRNLVNPELGLYILDQAQGIIRKTKSNQLALKGW